MKKIKSGRRLALERETLATLQPDALDSVFGGDATVNTLSRWTRMCTHSSPIHTCLPPNGG